jgi:hypothetical protein
MNIPLPKTHPAIQAMVDELTSTQVNSVSSVTLPAVSVVDEPEDIQHGAVKCGINLAVLWHKRVEKRTGSDCVFIFTATQQTSDGPDRFYFVGTLKEVLRKLSNLL